jgi:hypothetical protein
MASLIDGLGFEVVPVTAASEVVNYSISASPRRRKATIQDEVA